MPRKPPRPGPPAPQQGPDDYLWDPTAAPTPEIAELEALLRPLAHRPDAVDAARLFERADTGAVGASPPAPGGHPAEPRVRPPWPRRWRPLAVAAALVGVVLGVRALSRSTAEPWDVTTVAGHPAVAGTAPASGTRLVPGGTLETDATSRARLNVGWIGRAEVGPNSRLRLVRAEGTEHRLALERGTMHARIWAPPRFFLVETPSALAVDLGCVYSLVVQPDGTGFLRVESGQVELVEGTRRALVLAGNEATLHPGRGPGLPYPVDAPATFRRALAEWEATEGAGLASTRAEALDALLAASTPRTTVTLWHLLRRVDAPARARVYVRLATLAPPPDGVGPAAVLRLEPRALDAWRDALEPTWTTESVSAWKRVWRRVWSAYLRDR